MAGFSFLVLLLLLPLTGSTSLEDIIERKETALRSMVSAYEGLHRDRCSTTCDDFCTIPACGTRFDEDTTKTHSFPCNSEAGSTMCTAEDCDGAYRSEEATVLRIAPGVDFRSTELADDVCASNSMLPTFQRNKATYALNAYQYVSHRSGTLRMHPAIPQERSNGSCSSYDPRIRPWYVAAASGPKDVILILDVSGTMGALHGGLSKMTRLDAVKSAAKAVLETLTNSDYVTVVTFANEALAIGGEVMLQATEANIKTLQIAVDAMVAEGATNFSAGFLTAFDVLERSVERELTADCSRAILFLTDGYNTADSNPLTVIAQRQAKRPEKVRIFTYSMGTEADHALPQQIACDNGGIWALMSNGEDPLTHMSRYYQYLAAGVHSGLPRWTTPYEDAFGLGTLVTVAAAAYDRSGSVPVFIGVVGIDVRLSELDSHNDYAAVVSALIARSRVCTPVVLEDCDVQRLRGSNACKDRPTCPGVVVSDCNLGRTLPKLLCQELSEATRLPVEEGEAGRSFSDVSCCGCGGGGVGVVVVVVLVAFGVLVVVVVVVVWWRRRQQRSTPFRHEDNAASPQAAFLQESNLGANFRPPPLAPSHIEAPLMHEPTAPPAPAPMPAPLPVQHHQPHGIRQHQAHHQAHQAPHPAGRGGARAPPAALAYSRQLLGEGEL